MRSILPLFVFATTFTRAQTPVVIFTPTTDPRASAIEARALAEMGAHVQVIVAPGCYIASVADPNTVTLPEGAELVVDPERAAGRTLDADRALALRYLAGLNAGVFDAKPTDPPMDWGAHPEHAMERHEHTRATDADDMQRSQPPPGTEAIDWTCSESNNSEYLWGTVVANVFFLESNGAIDPNTWTWSTADLDLAKLQMIDTWSIWSYTASLHGRSITAIMNWYEPSGGMSVTGYEPITRSSGQDYLWIGACMTNLGYTGGSFGQLDAFNHDQRTVFGADHAATAFMAYNPSGAPSSMTDGAIGYAYLGGPYTQLLFRANGWSSTQINRVYGHELGHIFHAFDEYSASTTGNCTRAFNGQVNSNYQGSTCNGTSPCIMIDNSFTGSGATRQWRLCAHTPKHLGWYNLPPLPTPLAPIDEDTVIANPVLFAWNRNAPPTGVTGYVKVRNRTTGAIVYCASQGAEDTLLLPLVNGNYAWIASQGLWNDYNGYGGVIAGEEWFTVIAPLNAEFGPATVQNICAGSTASFTDQSTGAPTSWTWTFTGGSPSTFTGQVPPPIQYNTIGTYTVSLTVGDGLTTHTRTRTAIVNVTGGASAPFLEQFESGVFPPTGWTTTGGGVGGSQGSGPAWTPDTTFSCSQGISAHVEAYGYTGFAYPMLTTPRINLVGVPDPYIAFRYSYAQELATTTETLRLFGHDCTYGTYNQPATLGGAALATNGGALQPSPAWSPTTCAHWRTRRASLGALQGKVAQVDFRLDTQGGQNLFLDDVNVFSGCRLNLRVMLEGPFTSGVNTMVDSLRVRGMLPLTEPYSALGFVFEGEGGGEAIASSVLNTAGNNAIVDWLVIEVRDAVDPTKVLTSRAALLQRDGDVTELDGVSAVRVGVPAGTYHVAVRHRNHLGVMTAAPQSLSQSTPLIDLTAPATATWGIDARKMIGGTAVLWSGDVLRNGELKYTGLNNDRDPILSAIGGVVPTATVNGYRQEDCTLDGTVKYTGTGNDRDPVLSNIGGVVPTNTRQQQLP